MRRLTGLILVPFGAVMLLWCSPAFADPGSTLSDTTPGCQPYQVPAGVITAKISAVGAGGGAPFASQGDVGGSGGSVTGQIPVTGGQSLYVCVNVGGGAGDSGGGGGGGASGVAVGSDFSSPLVVAAGGGGADVSSGGSAGYPSGASGGVGTFPGPGGGGTATSGGSGGAYDSFHGSAGAGFTAAGPGSGGNGTELGGGGGAGYYGGGGGTLNSGGGGGSDYCDASVSDCQASLASSGPSVTIQYLAPQSITFPSTAVTYRQADFSPASSDSGLQVSYSNPSGQCSIDSGGLLQITGAGSCTVTADQAGNDEYEPATSVTQTLQINPAVVHVDADAASVGYGQPDPAASGTLRVGDFVNGDTAATSAITGAASCSIASHAQNAGTYTGAITCEPGTLASLNYTFTTGNAADLTIDAPPPSSAPTPPPSRTPVEPVAPVKPVVPNLLSVELTTHTVRWSSNDRFPRLWLTFTLSNPATVHLALQVRERGRWQALKSITVSAAAGHDGVQLVGLWQGALVPARHLRLIVRARTAAGRSAARILTFTVVHGHVRPVH
ncbi:MAG: MBG domain-containing protein [Solirubrobacteraceae bacterium]